MYLQKATLKKKRTKKLEEVVTIIEKLEEKKLDLFPDPFPERISPNPVIARIQQQQPKFQYKYIIDRDIVGFAYEPIGEKLQYIGQLDKKNNFCGAGQIVDRQSGSIWCGNFIDNKLQGENCREILNLNGQWSVYNGPYFKGQKQGKSGQVIYSDGEQYSGGWLNNSFFGQGEYIWPDGRRWKGEWDGIMHGKGTAQFYSTQKKDLKLKSGLWEHGQRQKWF